MKKHKTIIISILLMLIGTLLLLKAQDISYFINGSLSFLSLEFILIFVSLLGFFVFFLNHLYLKRKITKFAKSLLYINIIVAIIPTFFAIIVLSFWLSY